MDEYEKLEEEMMAVYEKYVTKYRNMMYLDFQLEGHEKAELEKIQVMIALDLKCGLNV